MRLLNTLLPRKPRGHERVAVLRCRNVDRARGLRAIGADVSLDIVEDEAHAIGQGLVNLGTTRVMQTLFRGRQRVRPTQILH